MAGTSIRFGTAVLAVAAMAACAPAEENLAVVANAPGTFGVGEPQRLLVGLVDIETSEFLASLEVSATATLSAPDGTEVTNAADFLWTIPGVRGLYRIDYTFDQEGQWWVRLNPSGFGRTPKTPFMVVPEDPMPGVGEPAPAVTTPTTADHAIDQISSDDQPNPAFYELSLDEALKNGQPTVVIFATPAFCVSQTCGPMLDQVKVAASSHQNANYVHIEIYENLDAESTDELQVVPAVRAWGLPSEPWVFVVDAHGTVRARFEGAMAESELEAALAAVGA